MSDDVIAAHAPYDWSGSMYDCKCGWTPSDERKHNDVLWSEYAAHVAAALREARTDEDGVL